MITKKPTLSVIVSRTPTAAEQATFDLIWKLPKGLTKDLFKKKGIDQRAADQLVKDGVLVVNEGVYSVAAKHREVEETPEEAKKADEAEALKARAVSPEAVEVETRLMRTLGELAEGTAMPVTSAEDQAALGLEFVEGETADKSLERHRALLIKPEDPKIKAAEAKSALKAAKDKFDATVTALTEGKATAEDVKTAKAEYDAVVASQAKATPPKAAKAKTEAKMGPCLDGCGAQVRRPTNFVPGHDAKFKSILLKTVIRDEAIAKRDALVEAGKADEAAKVKIPDTHELPRLTGEDGEHQKAYVLGAAWATPAMKSLFL